MVALTAALADAFAVACAAFAACCVVLTAAFEVVWAVLIPFSAVLTVPLVAVSTVFPVLRADCLIVFLVLRAEVLIDFSVCDADLTAPVEERLGKERRAFSCRLAFQSPIENTHGKAHRNGCGVVADFSYCRDSACRPYRKRS